MSQARHFIQELLDEGLISPEMAARHTIGDMSESDHQIFDEFRSNRSHIRCSIRQNYLSGWSWLIGQAGGGGLAPLLCIATKKDTCEADRNYMFIVNQAVFCALSCLFGLASLVTLVIWCRVKTPKPVRQEVGIQLLLLRVFSVLDLVGSLSILPEVYVSQTERTRVFSVFHAVLVASFMNAILTLPALCSKLTVALNFLTSIYLVEHSHRAQRALLFVSGRRALVCVVMSLLLCLALSIPAFIVRGYVYCVNARAAYILHNYYFRYYDNGIFYYWDILYVVCILIGLVTAILSIVYVMQSCCVRCRCVAAPETGASVAYAIQLDETDAEAPSEPAVTLEQEASVTPVFELPLADELRRLIFAHQAVSWGVFFAVLFLQLVVVYSYRASRLLHQISLLGFLPLMSVIFSPTFRRSFTELFLELKDAVTRIVRTRRLDSLMKRWN